MIRIDHLQKSFGTKTVLEDVSFHFPEGERIALVGSNGAGKSTLLDILTGTTDADRGEILRPSRLKLGYLPQEPNPNPQNTVIEEVLSGGPGFIQDLIRRHRAASDLLSSSYTEANHKTWEHVDHEFRLHQGYAIDGVAKSILRGLGFDETMLLKDPRNISGGWRMRLEIAKIFLNRPNFLILDEPTNHLDLPSLVWVESWLQNFDGTLVFVSHDQRLLRRLPTMTLHLASGKLAAYAGNFDYFLEERERRLAEEAAQAENLRRQREHLERFVERFGAKATKASQAQSKLKMIAKIRNLESGISTEESVDNLYLEIPVGTPSGREVLSVERGAIGYDAPLCQDLNLLVERGQRVAIIGANGIGKSTLLKTIAAELDPLNGAFKLGHNVRFAWFAQDQLETLEPDKSVLENVLAASADVTVQSARNILGALLFRGDDVNKRVRVLSGGEKARVGLARLLVQRSNFLLLDEPTNHLDISSCEILAQALQNYEGTILFVSHDREFIDSISTHVFAMLTDGRARLFEGRLADYSRQASLSGFPDVLEVAHSEPTRAKRADKGPAQGPASGGEARLSEPEITAMKREMQKNQKKLEQLNVALGSRAEAIADLDEQMGTHSDDFQKVHSLAIRRQEVVAEMESLEQQWFELTEVVERVHTVLKTLGRV